jgi:hypothetical protein
MKFGYLLGCAALLIGTVGIAQQRVASGAQISGTLAASDGQLGTGEYFDVFELAGRAGQVVELRLTATDFDTYVQINGPGEFVEANDDAEGTNSVLRVTLPADGTYRVMATSYAARETGAYRLTVGGGTAVALRSEARTDSPPPSRANTSRDTPAVGAGRGASGTMVPPPAARSAERAPAVAPGDGELNRPRPARRTSDRGGTSLAVGDSRTGELQRGDQTLSSGEYVDSYRFRGRRGDRVSVRIESEAFDTYAMLVPPHGDQIDNDDGPNGLNAQIDQVLTEDGDYGVRVTSYRPGETGAYTLTVAQGVEPPRQAAVLGGQRVYAVMVGVSDYGGNGGNDLQFTDDDATDLAETMRRAGVLNPASVTLTNAEGTVEGVRAAFARVAAAAGPDDLFLFFFSGHGVQVDSATDAVEPDGQDEVIVLRDGNISDDEMNELFGTLHTRMSLLILDSCYSGGFARDVINQPGRMGLFSSEEDLTSLVAEQFQAGGYLAHILRTALAGEADANGDSALAAGELAEYIRVQFNQPRIGRLGAETRDGQRNFQNLIVERGGVQVDDIVMRLPAGSMGAGRRRQ